MELGQRIKTARLAAGLSQRALCGDRLTRNMLSQIENGTARPSVKTLEYLAQRLEKPVSYFLEEQQMASPNSACMENARVALALGDLEAMREAMEQFREPDALFAEERALLVFLWHVRMGEQALRSGTLPYAVTLLKRAEEMNGLYITRPMRQYCRILLGRAGEPAEVDCDDILLIRAAWTDSPERKLEILAASDDREDPRWNLLQGEALFSLGRYGEAIAFYRKAEQTHPVLARLEVCCRETGDYKGAYEYACRQR